MISCSICRKREDVQKSALALMAKLCTLSQATENHVSVLCSEHRADLAAEMLKGQDS